MKKLLKKICPNIIKLNARRFLYTLRRKKGHKKKIITNYTYTVFGRKGYNVFFGYYDITPFGEDGKIIYLEAKKTDKPASIVINNLSNAHREVVAKTNSWNWQQGCRLRWMPNKPKTIGYNDFVDGKHCFNELDIVNRNVKRHKYPFYDISPNGELGITIDFTRLGYKRPGYGYTNLPFDDKDYLLDKGIDIVNMKDDAIIKTITYKEIAEKMDLSTDNYKNWYLNHLSFSPNGNKFLFFFIQDINSSFSASLLSYDLCDYTLKVLEKKLKVSHYDWLDDSVIMCTACSSERCWYNVYNTETNEVKTFRADILNKDGHPSYIDSKNIITDTYPDADMYQHLYYVNEDSCEVIADVFQVLPATIERRTDLHPRITKDKSYISFDCNKRGRRELIVLKYN